MQSLSAISQAWLAMLMVAGQRDWEGPRLIPGNPVGARADPAIGVGSHRAEIVCVLEKKHVIGGFVDEVVCITDTKSTMIPKGAWAVAQQTYGPRKQVLNRAQGSGTQPVDWGARPRLVLRTGGSRN
jgi:hypothetical protein